MKKFFSLLLPIITIVLIVGGTYFYMHSGSEKIKNEHSKYVSLINDDHDFGAGLKGLESLTTEKAKSVLSNVENEIETATELKSIDESLKNADIESAENHLDKAKQLDTSKTFGKATNWFNTEISNYKKAVEEINELDIYAEDYDTLLKNIVEKYHFNYDSIKKKLLGNKDNLEKKITSSLIIGAGKIAHYLIEFFIKANIYTKVIEINKDKAIELSETYPEIDVIWADGSDRDTLIEEGIQTFDSCISLTGLDEENIIINLYADKLGIKKTVAKVNRASLKQIAEDIGQYSYITPKEIVGNIIAKYSKSLQCSKDSEIENFYRIANNQAEVIEFKVSQNNLKVLGTKLKDMNIHSNMLIAFIVRNNKQIFPNGNDEIKLGDNVVIVSYKQKIEHIDDILRG